MLYDSIIGCSRLMNRIVNRKLNYIYLDEAEVPFLDKAIKCFTWQLQAEETCREESLGTFSKSDSGSILCSKT